MKDSIETNKTKNKDTSDRLKKHDTLQTNLNYER